MTDMTVAPTVELAGKRFVIVEEREYRRLIRQSEKTSRMTAQDWGDVAESKRRLAEPGTNVSWDRLKAERAGKPSTRRRRGA